MATTSTKASASTEELLSSWRPQVFINFRGADLRDGFMSFLTSALDENNINYYIDSDEPRGSDLSVLFERIRQSQIALVFFSNLYAESEWCLDELVEIMKNVEKGTLRVIPVFFKVKPEDVKGQKKEFGVALYGEGRRRRPRMSQWEDALESIPTKMGLVLAEGQSSEAAFLVKLIKNVKEVDAIILSERRARESSYEKIFRQSFEKVRKEKLLKSFACSLSTSAGPVMGVLHITSVKLAYCSDNPLSYEKDGQTEWTYYKVAIPLHQLKAVNPITSVVNPGEKYIEVILVDDKEFWFMDFLYYESAVSSLKDSLQAGALR